MNKTLIITMTLVLGINLFVFGQARVPFDARMNSGKIHYNEGRFEKAKEQFAFAVAENPKSAAAHIWLGLSLAHLKKFLEAAPQFDTAFALDSVLFVKMHKNEDFKFQAWTAFLSATRENLITADTNNWKIALHYTKQALRIEPKSRQALTILAQLYVKLSQLDELKQSANAILKSDPENPLSFTMIGLYFFSSSQWDSANYYYLESAKRYQVAEEKSKAMLATQLAIKDTLRLNEVAARLVAARRMRDPSRLKGYIEDSLKAKSKMPVILPIADDLYLINGELNTSYFRAGVANLQKASAEKDTMKQKQYFDQAQSEFEQALIYNSSDLDAKHDLAFIFYRKGNPATNVRAMTLYDEIVEVSVLPLTNPLLPAELVDSLMARVAVEAKTKKFMPVPEELYLKIETELAKKGSDLTGLQYLYFLTAGQTKSSSTIDKKDVFLSTMAPKALENLYLLYGSAQANVATDLKREQKIDEANKKYDEAIVSFNIVLAINPNSKDAISSLGVIWKEKGNKEEAGKMWQRLEELKKQK